MAKQVMKWVSEDGRCFDDEGDALRADLTAAVEVAAAALAQVIQDLDGFSRDFCEDARGQVCALADAMRREDAGPGAQDLRLRGFALAKRLREFRNGVEMFTSEQVQELALFAEDVRDLGFPVYAAIAREAGPLEQDGQP